MWRWAWGRCWQRPAVAVWPTTELGGCDCRSRRTVLSPKVNHKTSEWECDRARREVDTTRGGVKGPPPLGGRGARLWLYRELVPRQAEA